jgi:serine O-acetyltransferase
MNDPKKSQEVCKLESESSSDFRRQLPDKAEKIIASCHDAECYTHIGDEPILSNGSVVELIHKLREIFFPGYFTKEKLDPVNLKYQMGQTVSVLYDMLSEQIINSIRHDCFRYNQPCSDCRERGHQITLNFIDAIPSIRRILATDVRATYEGDPAAKSYDEIIFSYPGLSAITVYRVAHKLFENGVPLLPRIMTEHAHSLTGIDIHPGAEIGESFVIDHGTGVVIGETTLIGKNVRVYQGVTLGALSVPKGGGDRLRGVKRHPTIEDDVVIYSGATILGGDTVIGARSVIGGNVWLTESVPPDTTVMMETPRLIFK